MNLPHPSGGKLIFLVTEDWYFVSHRLELARKAREAGFEVLIATRVSDRGDTIRKEGFRLIPIGMKRKSANPFKELLAIGEIISIYRREKPDLVHHVAMKPIMYGSLAARITGVPCIVNAFAGLGFAFIGTSRRIRLIRKIVNAFFRQIIPTRGSRNIFQNHDDRDYLIRLGAVRGKPTVIIKGNGIPMEKFSKLDEPSGDPTFVLPGRMLWDKGVGDFVEAARILKLKGIRANFVLAGMVDRENPAYISGDKIREWEDEGCVRWIGHHKDIREVFRDCHVVVLPSYREGFPQALLEGAASGRALIATDVPGCREIVRDGENGILVPRNDPMALAGAMIRLIENPGLRRKMGENARNFSEREFSIGNISDQVISVYRDLLSQQGRVKAQR